MVCVTCLAVLYLGHQCEDQAGRCELKRKRIGIR